MDIYSWDCLWMWDVWEYNEYIESVSSVGVLTFFQQIWVLIDCMAVEDI